MENIYNLKSNFTMSELIKIEMLIEMEILSNKRMLEHDLENNIKKHCHHEIAELYSILDKLKIESIERVEK